MSESVTGIGMHDDIRRQLMWARLIAVVEEQAPRCTIASMVPKGLSPPVTAARKASLCR